jgi:hypothetical protein
MKLIIVRGFKELPWNQMRRDFVSYFFSADVIPDNDPFATRRPEQPNIPTAQQPNSLSDQQTNQTTAQNPCRPISVASTLQSQLDQQTNQTTAQNPCRPISTLQSQLLRGMRPDRAKKEVVSWSTPTGAIKFWKRVLWYTRYRRIAGLNTLVTLAKKEAETRKKWNTGKGRTNIVKTLVTAIFTDRGTTENFRNALAVCMKTGNMEALLNVIRKHLEVEGLGYNIVPSYRHIKRSTAVLVRYFSGMCKPERTYSGWRVNLVSCVKLATFIRLNKTDIRGLRYDIWGDGCEIGGVEVTRIVFRMLCGTLSAQSASAVFCFASKFLNKTHIIYKIPLCPNTKKFAQMLKSLFISAYLFQHILNNSHIIYKIPLLPKC